MSRGRVWATVLGFGALGGIVLGIYPVITKQAFGNAGASQGDSSVAIYGWITVCLGIALGYVAVTLWRRAPNEDEY